jgi:hypothetical protein
MVEFAALLSALSVLGTSLGALQQRISERLVVSDAVALQQALVQARAAHVPIAGARAAYRRAPYHRPALRYVYSYGWTVGSKRKTACAFGLLDPAGTRRDAIRAIRASSSLRAGIRRLHLTAVQAGTAFAAGFLSACGG